jgi:hypothetical protein
MREMPKRKLFYGHQRLASTNPMKNNLCGFNSTPLKILQFLLGDTTTHVAEYNLITLSLGYC